MSTQKTIPPFHIDCAVENARIDAGETATQAEIKSAVVSILASEGWSQDTIANHSAAIDRAIEWWG